MNMDGLTSNNADSTQERGRPQQAETPNGNRPRPKKTQLAAFGQPTMSFPLQACVILHGLFKTPNLNGTIGIILSGLSDGCHRVYLKGMAITVAIKPGNLKLDDTPLQPTSKVKSNSQKLLKMSILERAKEYVAANLLMFSACQDSQKIIRAGNVSKFGFQQ
jgi:hypothetical protein